MKTNIKIPLILAFSFFLLNNSNAQLKVRKNGTVKIGSQSPFPQGGILEITGINETLEARIFSSSENITRLWTLNSIFSYGFGIDQSGLGQIFSNLNKPNSIMTFDFYGNFGIGRVPTFKLDVDGDIRVDNIIFMSDSSLKTNIIPITFQLKNLNKLQGISYFFNKSLTTNEDNIPIETMNTNKKIPKKKSIEGIKRIHYGFIAQEVKKIYPELVYEDKDGILGVDYVSFIPLLLEELKKQNQTIENITQELKKLKETSTNFSPLIKDKSNGELFQNFPNPFNENTTIKFKVHENAVSANIYLYDFQGKQIKKNVINLKEENSIIIKGSELQPGLYFYSLVVDNKLIDTKQMILTN